jgi:hypothetical protein
LLTRLQIALAEAGRPLTPLQLPLARAWCQYEVLSADCYGVLIATRPTGTSRSKALELYRGCRRDQLAYSQALGLTPSTAAQLAKDLNVVQKAEQAKQAVVELHRLYGRDGR